MIDWKQAFDRQDPKLGVEAFLKTGVRPSLIPILINYFQQRSMKVKWKGNLSSSRNLPGGGPQGATLGLLEYSAQSNDNANFLNNDEKYKFVDDLSILEIINLVTIGITSYNFKQHVASDIAIDHKYLPAENLKSQKYLKNINEWTIKNKMLLNKKKTNYMIVNFTNNFQFSTRLQLEDKNIDNINEAKLLGTIITSNMKWHKNTSNLIRKAYASMQILRKLFPFGLPVHELVNIYIIYIRSIVEQSCVVWHSALTEDERTDTERVQKIAFRIILKQDYDNYEAALIKLNLETLDKRR